jgi:multimeric flavodoxin WrbA
MKIVAFNGSPRGQLGSTGFSPWGPAFINRILQPFLEGARGAGAETEMVYLRDKKIDPCMGCPSMPCLVNVRPGVCVQKDEMPELLEKYRQADVVVLATPLSFFSVSTQMKNFMDRLIPLVEPYGVKRGDGYTHGPRYKEQWLEKKAVIISNSGFPERQHFAGLVETFRQASAWLPEFESAAVILCPAGEIFRLSSDPETEKKLKSYVDAARSAGREMVVQGRIGPETQKVLDGDILEPEAYSRVAHTFFNSITIR